MSTPLDIDQCSTFFINRGAQRLFGKNVDWPVPDHARTLLIVNQRGRHKEPLPFAAVPSLAWTSRYGSVTFTGFGKELPNGGMNEVGLVIEPMGLPQTQYPPVDETPRLATGQWMQYVLDNCGTVQEAIEAAAAVEPVGHPAHFLVADRSGACASAEYLEGRLVIRTGKDLPVAGVSNGTYDESIAHIRKHVGFGGQEPVPVTAYAPLPNAVVIAKGLRDYDPARAADGVAYCFALLRRIANESATKRSTVYDIFDRRVYFHTATRREVRYVSLAELDFSPDKPAMALDANAAGSGDITERLVPLSAELNADIARDFVDTLMKYGVPKGPVPLLNITFTEMLEAHVTYCSTTSMAGEPGPERETGTTSTGSSS